MFLMFYKFIKFSVSECVGIILEVMKPRTAKSMGVEIGAILASTLLNGAWRTR